MGGYTYPQQSTISTFLINLNTIQATIVLLLIMEEQKKKSDVSPATTLPWAYSRCSSDDNAANKKEMVAPLRTENVPKEITAGKFNTSGKKYTLRDDDDGSINLIGIAHQIESQELGFAYEQEFQLAKEVELATQEARATAEAEREAAEERELQEIEEVEIEKLKKANAKKKRKPAKNTTKKTIKSSGNEDDAANNDDDNGKGKSRGKNLSPTDKLMVCKAYIATSEDPIHGNKIGSAIFCDKLEENYRLLYLGHIEEQRLLHDQQCRLSKSSNGTVPEPKKPPSTFCERPGQSIWKKFREIGNECTKFYSCEKHSPPTSGENFQIAHERHLEMYKERNDGKPFRAYECAEYLRNKGQKWKSVIEKHTAQKNRKAAAVKTERPTGKKRASKEIEKRALVESIAKNAISEIIEEKLVAAKKLKTEREQAPDEFFSDRKLFMAEASAGLKILLRDATMDKVMAKANTPDKAEWQKKQAAIALCEMEARSKQAILEMEKRELETKLDIARLKMQLESMNKENIN
jgi:hypothetical protein